jgi:hypothetical protein
MDNKEELKKEAPKEEPKKEEKPKGIFWRRYEKEVKK